MSGENQQVDASRTPDAPPSPAPVPAEPGQPAGRPSPPPSRVRRLAVPVSYLAGVTAAFAYVGAVDPNEPGHYPVCPLFRLTGVLCPGCGGLRSAHAFANGDLVTALGANALAVAGYFVFAAFTALWLVRAFRGGPTPRIVLRPKYWWALGALALVFALVRNFPFGSALAP
ncbi:MULTISPECIES: DUF2752 domain-containing protein [unclassified Streptomyces]|uniref:DUF2752 domain-containing protein n=1 Tax=unclassified Streptomyces TaxID=2593676 RepID=UPI002E153FBF|nr:DUF2752 domain-containing protein [Streptomyces sp. NBC_01207]WTA21348.1 DUF2752 domain-containing protein [Streptomyces sp. NBC_00853]